MNIIDFQNLSFQYKSGTNKSLTDISYSIEEKKITGILGPTNAGKSTLCYTINGIVPHLISGKLEGEVSVCGVRSSQLDPETVAQLTRHVGSVFQNPESQLFGLSIEEDIAFGPENLCVAPKEIERIIDETLELVGLNGFRRRSPYLLSGGQKQRVAIAAALAMHPEIILLDEPVSELDPVGKNDVMQIVRHLSNEGRVNIVIADHDPEQILTLAQEILVLDKGRLIAQGDPNSLFQNLDPLRKAGLKIPAVSELTQWLLEAGLCNRIEISEDRTINIFQELIKNGALSFVPNYSNNNQLGEPKGRPVILDIKDVSFHYPEGQDVLKHVNLQIYENDYIALVGANGSGKTTLAKHFNNILRPTGGSIFLSGRNLAELRITDAARRVGYVYQNPDHQIFARTVYEEVAFGPRNLGIEGSELKNVVDEALEFVGLTGQEENEPFFLGLGQRQRLAVASVLAMRPDILVVDEPDTGQDKSGAEEMMGLVDRLHSTGKTIIVISHNMELIAEHVQRVIAMSDGKILMDSDTRSFFSNATALRAISLNPPQVTRVYANLNCPGTILTLAEAKSSIQIAKAN